MSNILNREFLIEVAKGNVAGHEIVQTVGRNPNLGNIFEDVWCGGTLYNFNYDAQTSNFTAGLTLTGATSGATAMIVIDDDNGATGTLLIRKIDGIFQDGEIITDSSTGSATADGLVVKIRSALTPTTGVPFEVLCESTDDSSAGTGARSILVTFMEEATRIYITEEITLNGHTPVSFTSTDGYRFRDATVITYGSATHEVYGKTNLGTIVIRDSVGKGVIGLINFDDDIVGDEHGLNNSINANYTVEAGKTAYPIFITTNSSKNSDVTSRALARLDNSEGWLTLGGNSVYQNTFIENIFAPAPIPEKSDFKVVSKSDNDGTLVIVQLIYLVIEN